MPQSATRASRLSWLQPSAFTKSGRERLVVFAAVALLVVLRSLPYALFEQIQFDSDQAVFGLMAKHLSEGRAFPLFMYGNPYILAVEAWLAAPWFLVAPPTLATLSVSLILTNVAAAILIVIGLERCGLKPWQAGMASLFFVLPTPIVAGDFVSVSGGNVEPFLFVPLLWMLRQRPFWFGAVLALGFLQREFTAYALPVLLVRDAIDVVRAPASGRTALASASVRRWLLAFVVFTAVWQSVQALQPYADLKGPGSRGQLLGGFAGSQIGNLLSRANVGADRIPERAGSMVRMHIPRLLGAFRYEERVGHPRPWLAWLIVGALATGAVRAGILAWRTTRLREFAALERSGFAWYLIAVGVLAAAAYVATRPVTEEYSRYGLLVLFAPIGLAGVLLSLESRTTLRALTVAVVAAWASVAALDTVTLYRTYARREPNDLRVLANTLEQRGIRTAYAPYWTAYAVTFMTGERVKVASSDFVRIDEYHAAAIEHRAAFEIRETPCPGGEQVRRFYLCPR